jgi:hypothetical protein
MYYSIVHVGYLLYSVIILWLRNDRETSNETTSVARQQPARKWTGWKAGFSAGFGSMVAQATMNTTMNTTMRSGVFCAVRADGLSVGLRRKGKSQI